MPGRLQGGQWAGGRGRMYTLASGGQGAGGKASLGAVGDLPHDDVAALGLGQQGLHLVHVSRALLRVVVLSVTWGDRSRCDEVTLLATR